MTGTVTLVTPTFWGDLERFRLQRESIARCGITIPQIAIVQHEDLPLFAEFRNDENLTLLSTADVLPAALERRRRASRYKRRDPRRWQALRPVHGWFAQQFCKLAGAAMCKTEGAVCLDSDIVFVRKLEDRDFFAPDGTLHLYETSDDLDVEMAGWLSESMRFLGVKTQGKPLARYIHALATLHAEVTRDMQRFITKRHHGHWAKAMEAYNVYEYPTYGVFARHVQGLNHLTAVRPEICLYYWWKSHFDSMDQDFVQRVLGSACKAVLINSNGGRPVSSYRHLVEQAWAVTLKPKPAPAAAPRAELVQSTGW
jgi:hypothetical protein